jgi:hypothetical protein
VVLLIFFEAKVFSGQEYVFLKTVCGFKLFLCGHQPF